MGVNELHDHRPFADGRGASLGGAGADIAGRIDAWHARLQQSLATDPGTGEDESVLIASDHLVEPVGARACTEEQEQVGERQALPAGEGDGFELPILLIGDSMAAIWRNPCVYRVF